MEAIAKMNAVALHEVHLINSLLRHHNVPAQVEIPGDVILTGQTFMYGLRCLNSAALKLRQIHALNKEISLAISNFRRQRTPIRISTVPLVIEVPNPYPSPLLWKKADMRIGPGRVLCGRTYDVWRKEARQLVFDLDRHFHFMVAGMSGTGKSVLVRMMVLSAAWNNAPEDLQIWIVDLKGGRDLGNLAQLPHVTDLATTVEEADDLIAKVRAEVERRGHEMDYDHSDPTILVVVDEQAEMRRCANAVDHMNSIFALGRNLGVHIISATQYPIQDLLGGLRLINIPVTICGRVRDADMARYATGRKETGAQYLPSGGAFIGVYDEDPVRFTSYLLENEDADVIVHKLSEAWGGRRPRAINPPPLESVDESGLTDAMIEAARPVFLKHWNGEKLAYGAKTKIIHAMFGDDAPNGGSFNAMADEAIRQLKTTTTTKSKVIRMRKPA